MSYIKVGEIAGVVGREGEVLVRSFSDVAGRFEEGSVFFVFRKGVKVEGLKLKVEKSQTHRRGGREYVKVKFEGIDDYERAYELKGCALMIPEEERGELPEGYYFISDLIGMRVYTKRGDERFYIGKVVDFIESGGNDLLEIELYGGKKFLCPFVERYVGDVDVEAKEIEIKDYEGLVQ